MIELQQWAMRKRDLPEIILKVVMSLSRGHKMKVKLGSELSKEFLVQVDARQESVL